MTQMRNKADPELYNPKTANKQNSLNYNRLCAANNMKQPYIVTKKDIEGYSDPESFTGYIKYRKNYYICPRIWDYLENKPISAKKFIENGLRSPYNNGKFIPTNSRKHPLNDKYTVIIRKPGTHVNWEDSSKHTDWPEELKGTEKDAFPYLLSPDKHPNKLCAPCCGIKPPEDYDPNLKTIQQFFKLKGSKCPLDPKDIDSGTKPNGKDIVGNKDIANGKGQDSNKQEKLSIQDIQKINQCPDIMDQLYILTEASDLDKCKFGLLPNYLNIMLNNHQSQFLKGTQLIDNCSLFLRRGIEKNDRDNILESFSVIRGTSLVALKNLIITKLTPEVFVSLNNGELIDIYSSSNILPNSLSDYEQFAAFMRNYVLFFNLIDIDYEIIERLKYKDIDILNQNINDNTNISDDIESKLRKDANANTNSKTIANSKTFNDITSLKKVFVAYKIYSAFYNYKSHILDDTEYKDYTHFIDLFSKPIEWLNKEGANILIFDKTLSKLACNPYTDIHRKFYIILIREQNLHFVPVFHINYSYKHNKIQGIYNIMKVNLDEFAFNYFEKKTINKKILELTKDRSSAIIRLILTHTNICKFTDQRNTENLINDLKDLEIQVDNQIAFTTTQIEFIKVSDYLIPVYPMAIQASKMITKANNKNTIFKILDKNDMVSIDKYINMYSMPINSKGKILGNKLAQYNYKISKIFFDELKGEITSIQFINNLIVPIIPEKYTFIRRNEIINLMIKVGELKLKDETRIDNLFRPAYFDFKLEISPNIEIVNIKNAIYKDFIYNYFKYEFSRIIQDTSIKKAKTLLDTAIDNYYKSKLKYNKGGIRDSDSDRKDDDTESKDDDTDEENKSSHQSENPNKKAFQNTIDNLIDLIMNIMKKRISGKNLALDSNKHKLYSNHIKLKVCSKTKKINHKCKSNFCYFNEVENKCVLDMNLKQLEYFSYLLANDLINNKLESYEIINGSFIPEFNMQNKIYRNPNDITINPSELAQIIERGIHSKYKKNISLSEFIRNENDHIFNKTDGEILDKTDFEDFKKIINTIIPELVDLSIGTIFVEDKIYTTPFDKKGVYDENSAIGECKFPFWEKNKSKYIKQCVYKNNGYMCPTKLDYYRNPDKWGYCPEKIDETKNKLKVIEIEKTDASDIDGDARAASNGDSLTATYSAADSASYSNDDSESAKYKSGKCVFPFITKESKGEGKGYSSSEYKLKYECSEIKDKNTNDFLYSWCPIKYNSMIKT